MQEIKIFAGLSFVHAALLAIHPGAHRHAGTDRMMRVRKAGVSQRLYVIAQVQFVGSDRFVNRWRQCATQWMREVNTAAGTPRILRKVPLDGGQIIRLASAVCIVAHDDSLRPSEVIKAPQGFIHPDFAGQPHAGMFARQFRKMKRMESQPRVAMFNNPCSRNFQRRLMLGTDFRGTTRR